MNNFIHLATSLCPLSIILRLFLAAICGGILGFDREKRGQAAGFRTYMIVCVGSALVMMTNIFLGQHYNITDIARLPAAVMTGLGFLGAGAIIVTNNQNVRGLTTAAGLWTTAAIGIAFGAGFYLGAIVCFVLTVTILLFLEKLGHRIGRTTKHVAFYIEIENRSTVGKILNYASQHDIDVTDFDIANDCDPGMPSKSSGKFSFSVLSAHALANIYDGLASIDGVISVYKI